MSKSSMLKEGMKGGLNGLLSSTKKPSKEQMKYLAIKKGMSLRDIVNEAMTEYLKRHDT